MFIRFFLMKKSKSSTDLNPKEGNKRKQLSINVKRFLILQEKISRNNVSSGRFFWRAAFLGVIYWWDNYAGKKTFKSQIFSWGIFLVIIFLGSNYPQGQLSRGQSSKGKLSGGIHLRANFPQGNCLDTKKNRCSLSDSSNSMTIQKGVL